MGTRISIESKLDDSLQKDDSIIQELYDGNYPLFKEIQSQIEVMKRMAETIIPFPIEPLFRAGTFDNTKNYIQEFVHNQSSRLKWIGESSGFIPNHCFIYRHHDGDVFTFWRKHGESFAIKPYIPYTDNFADKDDGDLLLFEHIVLPDGAGIPPST